ncbi:hypothetical protein R6Q59_003944 [Mikania micrantha]
MIIKFGGKLGWEIYVAILLKDESIQKVQARILLLKSLRTDYDKNASRNKRQNDGLRLSQDIKGGVVLRVREATCAGHVVIKEPGEMILIIREIFSCLIGLKASEQMKKIMFVVAMCVLDMAGIVMCVLDMAGKIIAIVVSVVSFVVLITAASMLMIIKFEGKLGWEIYVAIMLKDIQDRFPALSLLSVFLVWKTKKWILLVIFSIVTKTKGNKLKTSLERNIGEKLRPKVPFCSNFSFNFKWSQIFVWIITLKWSGIPFPLTVTNAYCHRPTVVNIRQPPVVSWGLVHEEYLFPAGANRSISLFNKGLTRLLNRPHGLPCSADGSNSEVDNSITLKDVRIKIRKWADKQWLPVGAAGYAISCGLQMFIWCFFSKIVQECIFPGEFSEFESYYPFFISLMTSPLISACTGAILMTSSAFIAYVIERMRGKESYELKQIVGGLGGGVIVALCTGMRDPFSVFSFGVFWALIYGLSAKEITRFDDPKQQTKQTYIAGVKRVFNMEYANILSYW